MTIDASKTSARKYQQIKHLQTALAELPESWQVVPVRGKRPIGKGWNKKPYTPEELARVLQSKGCTGIGLLTGTQIDRLGNIVIAIDQDGWAAAETLKKLAEGSPLPKTVTFTSGKPGRCQRLFLIPPNQSLRTKRLDGGLELRCAGLMSVFPPSIHPETRKPYFWLPGCSPSDCAIAPAPEWLRELMSQPQKHSRHLKQRQNKFSRTSSINSLKSANVAQAASKYPDIVQLLGQVSSSRADDYHQWIRIGLALRSHGEDLLPLWDWWSQQSPKYEPGECVRVWQYFHPREITLGTLVYLARLDGNRTSKLS